MIDFLKLVFTNNIKFFLIVFGIAQINTTYTQNIEELYIIVQPFNTLMAINSDTIKITKEDQPKIINLLHGTYPIELWTPGYETYIDTITIKGDFINKYSRLLTVKTEEFKDYEKK